MSAEYGKIISLILLERFGEVVEKVGSILFKRSPNTLVFIKKQTELPLNKVKEALCVLIKHNTVTFKAHRNENIGNYTMHPERVMLMLRYPKYISLIKTKFGGEAEILLEEVLQRGYDTASSLILKTANRLNKDGDKSVSLPEIRDKLQSLIIARYLKRVPKSKEDKPVPVLETNLTEENTMPNLDIKLLLSVQNGATDIDLSDSDIYFHANFDRFHQDMRDKLIVDAITKKFDKDAGELVRLLLQQMYIRTDPWADVSNPVPIIEVKDLVRKYNTHSQLIAFFDQYINILEQDSSQIIRKAGEASGGSFQIYMKDIFNLLTWETIEQVVLEKFDSKAARIFRLVKSKKYIEPEQLQQMAMIPAKEAKKLSYELLEENFLQIQELRKAVSNNGPNKCFTLFHIRIDQVVRMVLELCYKTLFNIMTRRNHDKYENKRIIDKKQRIDTIALSMRVQGATEEQLEDIEEMLTPPEREILDKIDKTMKKLNSVELEVDDTIFLLQIYLAYE